MAGNTVEHKLRLLIETQLDDNSKQQVGKQLKNILEGAAIGFDEAETKKNLVPIIRMIQKLFDKAEMKFDADKLLGMPSRDALQKVADITAEQFQTAFDRALAKSGGVKIDFGNVDLSGMTEPLERLTRELSDIGERVASTTKKSVDEIERSLSSLGKNKKFKNIVPKVEDTLSDAANGKSIYPSRAATIMEKAYSAYSESVKNDNPWVVQYQHLLEFVSKYERLTDRARQAIESDRPEFKQLYDMLAPKAGAVKISLEHFVDISKGRELSEYKNQPWARESTLKEVAQTLKNGISVKGDSGNNKNENPSSETQRPVTHSPDDGNEESEAAKAAKLAREQEKEQLRIAEKRRKEEEKITKAIKEREPYIAYRAVESPETSHKNKADAVDNFGGEYWSTTIDAAKSYSENHYGKSSIISAQIKPVNPLIIDANELQWNDFENIPGLKEFFPGLLDVLKREDFIDDDAQKYINEQAKLAGFDSVIFKNVQDDFAADQDSDAPITDTITVLDDRIVSLTGAFAELEEVTENGDKMFSEDQSNVPEYYIPPDTIEPEQYLLDLQEKQEKSQAWYDDTISRLQSAQQQQEEVLNAAQQKLKENPKSPTAQSAAKNALEAVDATDALISKLQQAQTVSQKTFQVEIESFMKTSDAVGEIASDVQTETAIHKENATAIVAEEQAQEQLNESIKEKDVIESADNDHAEVAETNAETDAINRENEALKENIALKAQTYGQEVNVSPQPELASDATSGSGNPVETKSTIEAEELRNLLGAITYNVKVVQDVEPVEDSKISIDESALENVLNRITYNVKIAHDDTDKQANRIAIDESVLESTLKRVFTNVLNPQTEQASVEPTNEPWAREDTLNTTIKGALDQIQTNTSKIGAVSQTPANDVDSTLAQISKNVAEINAKIVKGTKATTKDTIKAQKSQADRDSQILAERIETQKLALKKFKTELETSGRMTDEMSKKIRGLSISLGMVKDNNGLTRWGQKFQQQKLDVGITDIANKGSIAEQNANIKKWISLSKQLGELDAKINSGLFDDAIIAQAKQERELVLRRIDEVMGLINNPDDGFVKAGEANFSGHYGTVEAEKSKQIGKLITQYEKLGQLQARAESSGAFVDREKYNQLYDEVQSETEILRLHEAQNSELLEALQARQENAYISEKDIEYAKEQKRLFAEYVSLVKQIGKLDGIINSDTADAISKLNAQTEKDALMRLADDIRPQLDLTREDLISAGAASMAGEEASSITQRQKALVDLAKQHKELGKLQAQEAHTQVAELQKKIDAQRIVLQLTQEEQDALAQITEEARQDALNKQADKDIKKQATNAKKMAQREAMLGKAGNAVGRAENTWMNAVGLDGELPADFIAEIDNYYQKLDAVRKMHQELKNSDMISEEQKKELIAQTMSINKMTDEIGELVSEYQRLSGDNVQVIGNNTLDSSAGLDAYEQQLKQAVITATNGKAQIKNFDAATKTLTYTVKTGKNEFTEYTAAVRRVGGALVSVQGATKRTETFLEATARKMKELTSYFSGMAVFNRVGQELRRGIQYVREIDLALTELKKVTDETEETYDRFLDTAAKTADKVGSTIQKVVSSTADWARLGSILADTNIRPII